ncbi:MAG TPA: DUF892 family protein [Actinomycetota bacterium]|nr:DUF892 family protein [Actinomycetota bacterium]
METAKDLFEHELRDLYDAEHKLVLALESMASKCSDQQLVDGFKTHKKMTEQQIARLEKVFELVDRKPRREPCAGITGLTEEFSKFVSDESPSPEVLDVFAASAAKKVEQYEIQAYSSMVDLATKLGLSEAADLLKATLSEEEKTYSEVSAAAEKVGKALS